MPKTKFNLKSEPDPRLIMLVFRKDGKKFQYSTGEKVPGRYWDVKKNRVRANRQFPAHRSINDLLNKLAHTCDEAYRRALVEGIAGNWPDLKEYMKTELDTVMGRSRAGSEQLTFYAFIDAYIEQKRNDKTISAGTVKVLNTWRNLLKAFDKSLSFEAITPGFKDRFTDWCYTEKKHSINYVAKGLEVVRQLMAAAKDRGLHENDYTQSKLFRVKKLPTSTIALSRTELDAIYSVDLSEMPDGYEKARTLFLIGAYTGLRHSDYGRIKPEHVTDGPDGKAIQIMARKTKQQLYIPLHPTLETILEQCGYKSPKLSQQKLNTYIKEVAKMAGITEKRAVSSSAGGEVVETFAAKYKLISSHTARRTFATQARINGWPTTLIRAITGHSSDAQLDNYIDYDMYLAAMNVREYYKKDQGGLKAM